MVLAASEDKTVRGGFVAAPNRPWAWANALQYLAVYHAVWSRDLYQIATGLLAIGDDAAANRALDFLWTVQQRADGSFPQNSRLDGTPVFGGLQMDEVAFPIVLAHQLGRTGAADWAHVKKSADYSWRNGPRRRRSGGRTRPGTPRRPSRPRSPAWSARRTSPRENGDAARARRYLAKADEWQRSVESLTATTNGPYVAAAVLPARSPTNGHPDSGTRCRSPTADR